MVLITVIMTHDDLINSIEKFLASTGMTATKFGICAVSDGNFVGRLRGGRSCTLRKAEKALSFITLNQHLNFSKTSPVLVDDSSPTETMKGNAHASS